MSIYEDEKESDEGKIDLGGIVKIVSCDFEVIKGDRNKS